MKTKHIIMIGAVFIAGLVAYGVGWHTRLGLALRGTSKLYIRNDSDTPLRNVYIPIANSIHPAVTNRFDVIQPHLRVRVPVPKSHIYLWEVAFEQGTQRMATSNIMLKVHMGDTLELVVDSRGKVSTEYEH